ncbi:hypothetical protein SPADD19_01105 [Streptococcus parasanguinis]|nr:hypothetical protein SPADD19_01105 [Streptococcus parasanguinis]
MNLLDNVIDLSPFFDNPSIAEDRGEDNENDFSEKEKRKLLLKFDNIDI